jgi:hypothetical protein
MYSIAAKMDITASFNPETEPHRLPVKLPARGQRSGHSKPFQAKSS